MLQNCLYLVGMIALPLAVEVLLAPRPCLALLWGALHSHSRTPLRTPGRESDGLTRDARSGPYLPGHMVLTGPRLVDTSTANVSPMPRQTGHEAILHGGPARGRRFRSPAAGREASLNK
jgi:hypothetical protein